MHVLLLSILSLLPFIYPAPTANVLKIGAFNIRVFGPTKASKADVMETIRKIVSAYDIVLIQEIRDKSGGCMEVLLNILNKNSAEQFTYIVSTRLGRTTSKEQYAFYYKDNKVTVLGDHLYDDTAADVFEREPYGVHIEVPTLTGTMKIVLIGVHIKPSDAVSEIKAMESVYNEFRNVFGTENILIMGDMNADCSYVSASKLKETRLFSDVNTFWSLISNTDDTTTYASNCAYDRIVAAGNELKNHELKWGIEHFETEFNLTETELPRFHFSQMKAVSDHFPVWCEVKLDG